MGAFSAVWPLETRLGHRDVHRCDVGDELQLLLLLVGHGRQKTRQNHSCKHRDLRPPHARKFTLRSVCRLSAVYHVRCSRHKRFEEIDRDVEEVSTVEEGEAR